MQTFRYDTSGAWFKGNMHIHSTLSDGGKTPEELAEMYADSGYDFLCRTDHWVASDVEVETDRRAPLLLLDGIELHGQDHGGSSYHVVCVGRFENISREMGFVAALESAREQGGLLILAHPYWTANSIQDALRYGFHGIEIYNHVCHWLNGKGDGSYVWEAVLRERPDTLGFAVDDAHIRPEHPGWDGGWIMVNARECSRQAILTAIGRGNYYSTCGPEFRGIELVEDDVLQLSTSPVRFVRLVGPGSQGARAGSYEGESLFEARFSLPKDWRYCRVEIEDEQGRRAWTNTLFRSL